MVKILKFVLLAAGTPSMMAPPADGIASPKPFLDAAFAVLKAILLPSGTRVPLMSRMLVIVMVLVPDVVPEDVTTAGEAVIMAECATSGRSSAGTKKKVPTKREPSVNEAVTV